MLKDVGWPMPDSERQKAIAALAYFVDPYDLIPDRIPGLGFLDDAIAIELAVAQCTIEKLRMMEREHRFRPDFRGSFFRSGTTGQWPEWFDDKDMRWFLRRHGRAMRRLGYL